MEKKKSNGKKLIFNKHVFLGHKDEEYYSEKQLLLGIQEYSWEKLSKSEIKFYENYERRKQKSNS